MSEAPVQLDGLSAKARADAIGRAAHALREGQQVVFPTETVYGLGVGARSESGLASLRQRTGTAADRPLAWHCPSGHVAIDALGLTHPAHRRLAHRLLPGPVTLVLEVDHPSLDAILERTCVARGVIDNGSEVSVRVPDHPVARDMLNEAGVPVVAQSIAGAGWGAGADLSSLPEDHGCEVVLDDGRTRHAMPSTVVRLRADGSFEVAREGPLDERNIRRHATRHILFVCTGNTCRSPMAEAIARSLIEQSESAPTTVESAGVSAAGGMPASEHVADALSSLGIDSGQHRSRMLTRQMIAEADAIYGMTPSHVQAILHTDTGASDKVRVLDPGGGSVSDPIGGPQDLYIRTAEQIRDLIKQRIEEFER